MARINKILISLVLLFFIVVSRTFAQATLSASTTGHVIAEIIPVFSASETAQLNFGRFAPGPQGGKVNTYTPEYHFLFWDQYIKEQVHTMQPVFM